MIEIAIIGAGEHAKVVVSALGALDKRPGFVFDEAADKAEVEAFGQTVRGLPEGDWWRERDPAVHVHLAVGNNRDRMKLSQTVAAEQWETIIHPSAIVHESVKIGVGVFISACAVIQPDAVIGDHAIINTAAVIEHDCNVGSFCHIAPSVTLCGNARVGEGTLVGAGSVVVPGIKIGSWAAVGAGSTIIQPVEDDTTVFGIPAQRRSHLKPGR